MQIFELTQGEDGSAAANKLAAILVELPPKLRSRIMQIFGITLVLKEIPSIRTDPSRVGFGAVRHGNTTFSIIIAPKLSLDVGATFRLIDRATIPSKPRAIEKVILSDLETVSSSNAMSVDWLRHTRDAAALRAISGVARRGRSPAYDIQHETLNARFKGQLDVSRFLRNSLAKGRYQELPVRHLRMGSFSLQDEVLANTARHIGSIKNGPWLLSNPVISSDASSIRSGFREVPYRRLTMRDVVAAGRPPYPFGYARALLAARHYWFNQGGDTLASIGEGDVSLWSAIVDLDYIFEMFVGAFLEIHLVPLLGKEIRLAHQQQFRVGIADKSIWSRQDWVLTNASKHPLCVVDAKYKNVLDRENDSLEITSTFHIRPSDVYQIQAYLAHRDTGAEAIGLLIYPAVSSFLIPVEGFRNPLFAVGVPVSGPDLKSKWIIAAEQVATQLRRGT